MNLSFIIKLYRVFFLLMLSGCVSNLADSLEFQCVKKPIILQSDTLSSSTRRQLTEVLHTHGIAVSNDNQIKPLDSFKIKINSLDYNFKALYQESTSHNLFRNIEARMIVTAYDIATDDILWEKQYNSVHTIRCEPHFYTKNQLALAQSQWELQRDLFSQLTTDLLKLCAIQVSGVY
jgi:outer membrane lipopolysaccharide assembly protein LptE/RlpB